MILRHAPIHIDTNVDAARLEACATLVGDIEQRLRHFRKVVVPGIVLIAYAAQGQGQPPDDRRAEFDVTSVKINKSGPPTTYVNPYTFSAGRFRALNVTLGQVLLVAFNVPRERIQGGPDWIDSERFDIDAVGTVTRQELLPMIQKLLADRFGLSVHRETKDVRAYVVLIGKTGHKLQAAKDGEVTGQTINFWGLSTFEKISMPNFAQMLTAYMRQPVVDRTGLTGFFDFKLDLTPEPGGPPNTFDTLRRLFFGPRRSNSVSNWNCRRRRSRLSSLIVRSCRRATSGVYQRNSQFWLQPAFGQAFRASKEPPEMRLQPELAALQDALHQATSVAARSLVQQAGHAGGRTKPTLKLTR
jgi:uncharacterized protein (TIGR03435 family)